MATGTTTWRRRMMATGVVGAAVLTPLLPATPASGASLCAPPADTVPPQVNDVTFSTQSVDLSGPRSVTVTVATTDTSGNGAGSGVASVHLYISGPHEYAAPRMSLASGTPDDGDWTGRFTIPKDGAAGTMSLQQVFVQDAVRNEQFYGLSRKHAGSPTDISLQSGWDRSITVTGTGTPPPTTVKAGKLTGFGFAPQTVDTTESAKKVHVTATFSAPLPTHVWAYFAKTSGSGRGFELRAVLKPTTGGQFAGHLTVHRWLGVTKARPQIRVEYAADVKPRFRFISADALQARHFPSVLKIASGVDNTKPTLNTLTFSPSSVDTTTGAKTVTVTATATDARSGVARVQVDLSIRHGDADGGPAGGLYPYPGLGYAQDGYVNVSLQPSGGQWVGTFTLRRCVPSGTWHATAFVVDRADNYASYSTKKLAAAGLTSTLAVTSTAGDVEDPEVRDATASGVAHQITLDFTEGVKNVSTSTLTVFAMKPASTRYQHAATVTAIICSNGVTAVDCSGTTNDGLVTSAVLTVDGVVGGAVYQVYGNLDAITSQLTDGAGNPLPWVGYAADVTGS